MGERLVTCPHCAEQVPPLEDCVACGRELASPTPSSSETAPASFPSAFAETAYSTSPFPEFAEPPPPPLDPPGTEGPLRLKAEELGEAPKSDDSFRPIGSSVSFSAKSSPAATGQTGQTGFVRKLALFLIGEFVLLATLGILFSFHFVKGGRLGRTYHAYAKYRLGLKDSFVNLDTLIPNEGAVIEFRRDHRSLYRVLKLAFERQADRTGVLKSLTREDRRELRLCYAQQEAIEAAMKRLVLSSGKRRVDVGTQSFYQDLQHAGLFGALPKDPGRAGLSWNNYYLDPITRSVTCSYHGGRLGESGEYWKEYDYQLFMGEARLTTSRLTPFLRDMVSKRLNRELTPDELREFCLSNMVLLATALRTYVKHSRYELVKLDRALINSLVGWRYLPEALHCPTKDKGDTYLLRVSSSGEKSVRCSQHPELSCRI